MLILYVALSKIADYHVHDNIDRVKQIIDVPHLWKKQILLRLHKPNSACAFLKCMHFFFFFNALSFTIRTLFFLFLTTCSHLSAKSPQGFRGPIHSYSLLLFCLGLLSDRFIRFLSIVSYTD